MNNNFHKLLAAAAFSVASFASATPTTYHYDGNTLPTVGTYGTWFTTVGANAFGYFPATSWSSNGSILTMTTVPIQGIWFGHSTPSNDPTSTLNLATTAEGNWARARVALAPGATEWSFYFRDASGFFAGFYLKDDGFEYSTLDAPGGSRVTQFQPVADMTNFHVFTTYILAGQVSYFFDNTYLGGGPAVTGASNQLVLGDGSGSTPTGVGSMYVDYMTVITAVGDNPPSSVPEPSSAAWIAAVGALGLAVTARRRRF